jgi:TolA-binding protein
VYRAVALVLLASVVVVLALKPWDAGDAASARVATLEEEAREMTASLGMLEDRIAELEGKLNERSEAEAGFGERLASIRQRLDNAVQRLRRDLENGLRDARSEAAASASRADSAAESASSALSRAQEAARDLRVLEDRFNVHMRRHHGG